MNRASKIGPKNGVRCFLPTRSPSCSTCLAYDRRGMLCVSYWIDRLEDPFEMFPMQSVARALGEAAKEQEERRFGRASPWGVSSAYYTVEDEHDIEVVEHLVGAAFVLGQAA